MGYQHLDAIDMSADYDSGVINFRDSNDEAGNRTGGVFLSWSGVTGTKDGTIVVKAVEPSNAAMSTNHSGETIVTITVDAATGQEYIYITEPLERLQVVYTKNNITAGSLKVSLQTNT